MTSGQLTDVGNVLTGDLNGLMSEGEIGQTVQDVGGLTQAPKATGRVVDALSDLGNSVVTQLTTGIDAGEVYQVKTEERQRALEKQRDDVNGTAQINNITEDVTADAEQVQDALADTVNGIQDSMGVAEGDRGEVTIYDGGDSPVVAYTDTGETNQNDIGFNVGENGVDLNDGSEIWKVAVHESAHTDGEGERMAHLRTDAAKRAWERENAYNGNMTGASGMEQSEWVNNQKNSGTTIQSGTAKASDVEEFDAYNPQWMLRNAYNRDTARNADEDWELIGDPLRPVRQNHYNRSNNNEPDLATIQLPQDMNIFHTQGENAQGNIKFVSPDGHHEKIVDANGDLVTDPLNMGTYNFASPDKWARHGLKDVAPYLIWGNTPDDSSTGFNRTMLLVGQGVKNLMPKKEDNAANKK